MSNIQLFRPIFRVEECLAEIRECLEKGWTGIGFKTVELEEKWKAYTNLPNAHFLNSATAGLHLAVRIMKQDFGWNDGDEIITTPLTFVSTNHAILYENLKPVFADVDESLNISPDSFKSRITSKTKAVLFVGMGGNAENLLQVANIAKELGIKVILDASHMAGTRIQGNHIGQDIDVSIFSFQAVKNLPTCDSGMICFMKDQHDKKARELSWLGINKDTYSRTTNQGSYKWMYEVDEVGYKYHGNSIAAAIGIVSLKYIDEDNAYRRKIVEWYKEYLQNENRVKVIEHTNCESSRHLFQILVENRDEVLVGLNNKGIYPGVHYRCNTEYKPYEYAKNDCPQADFYSHKILSLPLHLQLSEEDVKYIAHSLRVTLDELVK